MPVQRSTTSGAAGEDGVELFEDQLVDRVGREGIGCRRVVMRIADDQRAVGALHDDEVHAVLQLRALLLREPRLQRRSLGQRGIAA